MFSLSLSFCLWQKVFIKFRCFQFSTSAILQCNINVSFVASVTDYMMIYSIVFMHFSLENFWKYLHVLSYRIQLKLLGTVLACHLNEILECWYHRWNIVVFRSFIIRLLLNTMFIDDIEIDMYQCISSCYANILIKWERCAWNSNLSIHQTSSAHCLVQTFLSH